jgi:O-methyltransferase involved in polyketide biosynthesis
MSWPGGTRTPGTPPDRPSRSRIYSYWLGGYDYTAVDQACADQIERVVPPIRQMVRNNRLFAGRAVAWAAHEVTQVVDLSCGFPLPEERLDEIARSIRPSAAVCYVDDDPEVADGYDVLFGWKPPEGVAVASADFRDPGAVLGNPRLLEVIDPSQPVCLLMAMAVCIMPPAEAAQLVAGYAHRIAPGSLIAVSCPVLADPAMRERLAEAVKPEPVYSFGCGEFAGLFGGLELVPPGIAPAVSLRPGWERVPEKAPGPAYVTGAVARKPR